MLSPDDVRDNLEAIIEKVASLQLAQNRDELVLYGSQDIHLPGLITKVEEMESAIKAINGMPEQVRCLDKKVGELIETDKKRIWLFRGIVLGIGFQVSSALGLFDLIKGLL